MALTFDLFETGVPVDCSFSCPDCGNTYLYQDGEVYLCDACGVWFTDPTIDEFPENTSNEY
ncbi:MAG: hypothetical protein WBB64_00040 [Anaerolineales bacterium]